MAGSPDTQDQNSSQDWRVSFDKVGWSYPRQGSKLATRRVKRKFHGPLFILFTHDSSHEDTSPKLEQTALQLNPELAGIKCAEEVLKPYEEHVGFQSHSVHNDVSEPNGEDVLSLYSDDSPLVRRQQWAEHLHATFGDCFTLRPEESLPCISESHAEKILADSDFASFWDLRITPPPSPALKPHSPGSLTSSLADLTDSDLSTASEPLPKTPKTTAPRRLYADVASGEEKKTKPSQVTIRTASSKRLNASATSFTPSRLQPSPPSWLPGPTSSPSPNPYDQIHFPSLNSPQSAPQASFTDSVQDYYAGVTPSNVIPPRRQSASPAFPAFLLPSEAASSRKASKTREIIDGMKSAKGPTARSRRWRNGSKGQDDEEGAVEGDGWIKATENDKESTNVEEDKKRRTRELVAALGGRDSAGSKEKTSGAKIVVAEGDHRAPNTNANPKESRKQSRSRSSRGAKSTERKSSSAEDGWIGVEGPSPAPVQVRLNNNSRSSTHSRAQSSVSSSASVGSIASFTPPSVPPPLPYLAANPFAAYPSPPPPAYSPMTQMYFQIHAAQMQAQAQVQAYSYNPYASLPGGYGEVPLSSKVITGVAGMRHTPW